MQPSSPPQTCVSEKCKVDHEWRSGGIKLISCIFVTHTVSITDVIWALADKD
jgi:hypothetical protein